MHDPEDESDILHSIPINPCLKYQESDKCLIQWTDEIHREYALSFLTSEYRDLVFAQISEYCNSHMVSNESASLLAFDEDAGGDSPLELPSVSMATFPAIVSMMYNAQPNQFVPLVTTLIQNDGEYLHTLLSYAQDYIDMEDLSSVHDLAKAIMSLIQIGSRNFINCALSDKNYLLVFGVLDYYDDTYQTMHAHHREVFENRVTYHKVLEFQNTEILRLIHLTFRLMYIRVCESLLCYVKDAVRVDMTELFQESSITILIKENLRLILQSICSPSGCVNEILQMLNPENDDTEVIGLVYELLYTACLDSAPDSISTLFQSFCGIELGDDMSDVEGDDSIVSRIQIKERLAKLNTAYCNKYFFDRTNPLASSLFSLLLRLMLYSDDYGVQQSVFQTIGTLVGRDPLFDLDDREFIRLFYTNYVHQLTDALISDVDLSTQAVSNQSRPNVDGILLTIELLSAFISIHQSFMHSLLEDGVILMNLARLLDPSHPAVLRCAVIRFLNSGVSLKTEWFAVLLVRKGMINEVYKIATISVLQKNNLLAVSLFHFFNTIYLNKQIELLINIAANVKGTEIASFTPFNKILEFSDSLSKTDSVPTSSPTPVLDQEKERMDEEAYFDSEEEENVMIPTMEQRSLPSFGSKEEEEEIDSSGSSVVSFFGSGLRTSTPIQMNLTVNLGPPEGESESKRVKVE
ncbi:hypothetical protein JH06_3062 [Blastocystis sp. subtype 4]|uniref:hypothetical protein n=1 Tax=Blastocystis sp. subtype 4 TaxID=944170 RepID=UPI000711F9BA|nr:hypothetical protein JH06_3062 [Blastocystis sp. subtype 4]KNB43937.1 hypothetical protein JH06_3062 [Blastocystis sp. subtype 4]|eukprot:XP_014527380.1 hypothetical protein JH06_3062 [Blastocystis sp. subtype 4]